MKKILGFIFQLTALVALGYVFLNNSLLLVADWLSPLLSGRVYSFFTLLYLVAADPVIYPKVLAVWASASVIAGVFVRKRLGAVLSVISTWFFIISVTAVLAFGIVLEAKENIILEEGMDPFEVMPPFPDGLTITTISEAPILGEFYRFALDLMSQQVEELEPTTVLRQFAALFTFSIVSKPVISVIFSLLGVELGKRLEHLYEPTITAKRLMLKERLVPDSKIIVVLFVLFSLFLRPVSGLNTDLYMENFVTVVDEDGRAFVAGAFAGTNVDGLESDVFSFDGFIGCALLSHEDILDVAYEYMETPEGVDFSEMLNLLPETIVVFLYIDVEPVESQTHSDKVAFELSAFYDMEISMLFPFFQEIIEEGFTHTFTVNIYQSPITLEEFNIRYLKQFQEYGGYIDSISMDQLIPGNVEDSVDGSLLFTGYLNPVSILELVPVDASMVPEVDSSVVGFSGFIGYWDNYARILDESLSLEEIFNLNNEPENSYASDFSSSIIIAPGVDKTANTLKMSSSIPLPRELQEIVQIELVKMGVQAEIGGYASRENMEITLEGIPIPLDLHVTREVSSKVADIFNVKLTLHNKDSVAAEQIVIDDTSSFEKYQNLASNGNVVQRYTRINPGESIVFEYTIDIENSGSYTLSPVKVSYMNRDRVYETESDSTNFYVERPSVGENLGNTFSVLLDTDEGLSNHLPSNINTGLQVSTYGIILYTVIDSVRKLRGWILR